MRVQEMRLSPILGSLHRILSRFVELVVCLQIIDFKPNTCSQRSGTFLNANNHFKIKNKTWFKRAAMSA